MIKKILVILFVIFFSFYYSSSLAEKKLEEKTKEKKEIEKIDNFNIDKIKNYFKVFRESKKNYFLKENINFDLSNFNKKIKEIYDNQYEIIWKAPWKKDIKSPIFNVSFDEVWEKEISFNILDKKNKKIIYTKKINIFIYKKIIPFIFSKEIPKENIYSFINTYKKNWTFIYNIWILKNDELKNISILEKIYELDKYKWIKTDFIWIRWWKDFIFDIFSKIDLEKKNKKDNNEYSFLTFSNYNIKILDNYLNNFIAKKPWLKKVIITDNKNIYSILDINGNDINSLKKEFIKNKISFQDVRLDNTWINKFLFISNFINNLSNKGFDTNSIYIFILIPFLLTAIWFIKHFIWFSPLWITIPLFLTILFFKFSFLSVSLFFFWFIIINIILSLFFSKYILLYTPKISMLLIINIVIFILVFNILNSYNLINLNLDNIFYLLLFVIISERIISIILSKELQEYKSGILNTYFISLFLFLFFVIPQIKILILAFPEVILVLIPLNFLIWKFTGLRITEYFRFKEVIKNIEE